MQQGVVTTAGERGRHERTWHDFFRDDKDLPVYPVQTAHEWLLTHPEGVAVHPHHHGPV